MTKQEALEKIKELENYIKELDEQVGFEDDEIFLLSKEEYEKYKDEIPYHSVWWWLRSPSLFDNLVAGVYSDGDTSENGHYVDYICAVRPAIHIPNPNGLPYKIGERIMRKSYPWIVIDEEEGIAIAETPISFRSFDKENSNYENAEIRKFLLDWWENR